MKTLADLKRDANKYEWFLISNSWFPHAGNLSIWRKVVCKDTVKIGLATLQANGTMRTSYLDFPKAKELSITPHTNNHFYLTITRDCGDKDAHIMIYELKPISEMQS